MTLKHLIFIVIISLAVFIPILKGSALIEKESQSCRSNGGVLVKTYDGFTCVNNELLPQ